MGLNITKTQENGVSASYWKIAGMQTWYDGYNAGHCTVHLQGYTTHGYRESGANSVMDFHQDCPYSGATDYYSYEDLTGVSGVITGSQRLGPALPSDWSWKDNGVSGWMDSSNDIRSGAYDWVKVCSPYFSGATDEWTVGEA